jgi:hypothetical protein
MLNVFVSNATPNGYVFVENISSYLIVSFHTLFLTFQLADDRHEVQTGVDDLTSRSYQFVSVELTRQDVESELADSGEYLCYCYAFSTQPDDEGIRSDPAKIRLACKFQIKHVAHLLPLNKRAYVNLSPLDDNLWLHYLAFTICCNNCSI